MQVANTIYQQIGGKRFSVMTGAKNFVGGENKLMFNIGRNSSKANRVVIELTANDDYTMTFYSIRGMNVNIKKEVEAVYFDQLQAVFTEVTGMYTKF